MYYDEQVVDGVLCHRSTPKGEWVPFTSEELTEKYTELSRAACALKMGVFEYLGNPGFMDCIELKNLATRLDRAL